MDSKREVKRAHRKLRTHCYELGEKRWGAMAHAPSYTVFRRWPCAAGVRSTTRWAYPRRRAAPHGLDRLDRMP